MGWPLAFRAPAILADILIRNIRVIDGTGSAASMPRDVMLHGGRIAKVSDAGTLTVRRGIRIIDGTGQWLIPGLIDLHVHMRNAGDLPGYLASGVTTIRDTGTPVSIVADIASSNAAGVVPGPRVVYGGFQYGAGSGTSGEIEQFPADSAGIARSVSLARSFGVQYLKHRPFSGWAASAAIIREGHRHGMRVSGHCTHPLPMLVANIDGREHAGQCFRDTGVLYEDVINGIRSSGMWVVPTVALYSDYLELAEDSTYLQRPDVVPFLTSHQRASLSGPIPPATRTSYARFTTTAEDNVRKMHVAGIRLGAGSDSYFPTHLHFELAELTRSGLTPAQAIAAATSIAARILGADADIGTIQPGKLADLILLDADPLVNIRNTQRISVLIQGGRIVDRAALARKDPRH
ncbi:MAG: amidohydrolase family protein [Chloroflexota bacterium]|nr:amidohydrolase family protein [Chloroflexota bacterium]